MKHCVQHLKNDTPSARRNDMHSEFKDFNSSPPDTGKRIFKLTPSRGQITKMIPPSGEHEAVISNVRFYQDNGAFAVFVFTLQDGTEITQLNDTDDFSNRSKIAKFDDFVMRIRELAAAIGIDLERIDTDDDFKQAFEGARVVIDLEISGDGKEYPINIRRFAPSRLNPRKSRA